MTAVLAGLAATAAGIGYLITLLREPNPPRLVVVGADPAADALRLDLPPDYAGWTTGRQLIAWGKSEERTAAGSSLTAKVVSNGDNPDTLPTNGLALDDWVGKLAGSRFARDGRVLIYLGLHAGVELDGSPFLWVGKGDRLKVGDLFTRLADKLAKRDVIVLFDPGRLPPDPLVGRLADSFADQLKKDKEVKAALEKHPRLLVVCGADSGETGWESEELQATAFGQALLRGLRGEGRSNTNAVYAHELFDFLKTATVDWSAGNRPTRQTPFLLPAGEAGTQRAASMVAAYKSGSPSPAPAVEAEVPRDTLKKLWQKHDELGRREIPPSSYAPLAWRRGRELLIRYQQAVRAGERGSAELLATAVRDEFTRVEGAEPKVVDKSRSNSITLARTFGDPAAEADKELDKVSDADGLRNLQPDRLKSLGDNRPAEALLACMIDDFYRNRAGGIPSPPGWSRAVIVRRAAERAAFGGGPFGERAWPAVQELVTAADARRRDAEDRLFASPSEEHSRALAALTEAATGYDKAIVVGKAVRDGSKLRDELFADLPFLGRWAATVGQPDVVQAAITAWEKAHRLADELDNPKLNPSTIADDARAAGDLLRRQFQSAVARLNSPPESQDAWEAHERLLSSPLVPADLRAKGIDFNRGKTRDWLEGKAKGAGSVDVATRVAQAKEAARNHARLTAAALGAALLDAQHAADDSLPRWTRLEAQLTELTEAKEDWTGKAAGIGSVLLGHLRRADSNAIPKEYADPSKAFSAERISRSVVQLNEDRTREPAEVAAAMRWQALLVGLADRTARDHWYDEGQEPYWRQAANRFLADARRAIRANTPKVTAAPAVPADYPDAARLTVKPATGTPDPVLWTSQRRRSVGFQVEVPAGFPKEVKGLAVGWRTGADGVVHWDAADDRLPMTVAPEQGGTLAGILTLNDGVTEDTIATITPSARVFFRGQRPDGKLTVKLNRKPERVIIEPLPTRHDTVVAVRAEPDVPLGQVAILIDYSGSMRADAGGDGKEHPNWRTRDTKFKRAQEALRQVLAALPKGTPLHVRLFSAARRNAKGEVDPEPLNGGAFPEPGGGTDPTVTWESTEDKRYRDLVARLGRYEPFFFTPLEEQIRVAVERGFERSGPRRDLPKTLVVLTDGVDETKDDTLTPDDTRRPDAERATRIRRRLPGLKERMRQTFTLGAGRDVALFVVPFGQDKSDEALSRELFSEIDGFPQPGRLWKPTKNAATDTLVDQLLGAIFPKLKLLGPGGIQPAAIDSTGLPSRPDRRRQPPYSEANGGTDLRWSPTIPPGTYIAQPYPAGRAAAPRLTLRDADALVLGFARDTSGGVRVRRELYSEYFQQVGSVSGRRPGGKWAVTCPWPTVDRQKLEVLVYVERVPPHRQTPADDRPVDAIAADPPDVKGDGRELVWFDVLPVAPGVKPGKLTVTRVYGHAAPAWQLDRDDWSGADLRSRVLTTIATHDEDGLPEPRQLNLRLPRQDEAVTTVKGNTDDDNLEVRTSIEQRPPDGPAQAGTSWLVVRISHRAGRPVYARLVDDRLKRAAANHRYYPADGNRAEYTAAFAVPTAELGRLSEVSVNLANVGWAVSDANRERLTVTLDPANPKLDRLGAPKAVEPANPGDR